MRTEFVSRAGEHIIIDISTSDPCPECCGGLEPVGDPRAPRAYRCTSCGLDFRPYQDPADGTAGSDRR